MFPCAISMTFTCFNRTTREVKTHKMIKLQYILLQPCALMTGTHVIDEISDNLYEMVFNIRIKAFSRVSRVPSIR